MSEPDKAFAGKATTSRFGLLMPGTQGSKPRGGARVTDLPREVRASNGNVIFSLKTPY